MIKTPLAKQNADRLLDLSAYGEASYALRARSILNALYGVVEREGGYPEVLSKTGILYRTWAYQSAMADSWFPRFVSVWARTFGATLVRDDHPHSIVAGGLSEIR